MSRHLGGTHQRPARQVDGQENPEATQWEIGKFMRHYTEEAMRNVAASQGLMVQDCTYDENTGEVNLQILTN